MSNFNQEHQLLVQGGNDVADEPLLKQYCGAAITNSAPEPTPHVLAAATDGLQCQKLPWMLEPQPISMVGPPSFLEPTGAFDAGETSSLLQLLQKPLDKIECGTDNVLAAASNEQESDEQLFRALSRSLDEQGTATTGRGNVMEGAQLTFARGLDMGLDAANSNLLNSLCSGTASALTTSSPPMALSATGASSSPLQTVFSSSAQAHNEEPHHPPLRFKPFHEEKWSQRLEELRHFRKMSGHCLVPHTYPHNPQLARWVKRQRRQYKLMIQGKASTLTSERVALLEDIGFVWDSHVASWTEKVSELRTYRAMHGNTLVPSGYKPNPSLAVWVKCQRRQYKLYREGKQSAMTPERIQELEAEGFCWEVRPPTHAGVLDQQLPQRLVVPSARVFGSMAA